MGLKKKRLYRYVKTILYIVMIVFSVFPCPDAVLAGEQDGVNNWMLVIGCSIAEGSVVSPTTDFTFKFSNNVANASVRDYNSTKFSLETMDGFSVGIWVDIADDQIEPDLRHYITVIPDTELAPGSYCLTAHAGICAKGGKITENDFLVHFTVEGEETPTPEPTPELTPEPDPELTPDPLTESGPDPKTQDSTPDPVPTQTPSPPSENINEEVTESEQNQPLLPGTDGGNGGGSGEASENGGSSEQPGENGQGSGAMTGNQESDPSQTPAADKPETNRAAARKTNMAMEKEPEKDPRFSENEPDFQDKTTGPSEHYTVMKIKLGGTGEKMQMEHRRGTYRSNLDEKADLYNGAAGSAGGTLRLILMLLLGTGAIARTVRFRKDIV